MGRYYKLIDPIQTPTTIRVCNLINGVQKYSNITLCVGKKYEMAPEKCFEKSLRNATTRKPYNIDLENTLKKAGVEYKLNNCKTCGGRKKTIEYCVIEVVDDGI